MKKQIREARRFPLLPQARTTDLVVRELPDEELVYDLKTHRAHCLNKLAVAVWKQCDGQKTIAQIVLHLQQETNPLVNDTLVQAALQQLGQANLLEPPGDFSVGQPHQSRRAILKRIGWGAAFPMVSSIIAPSTAQAMSCGDPNNNTRQNAVGCPCLGADDCTSNCCGETPAIGNICVVPGSVPSGAPCRANCECASGSCPAATDVCT